MHVCVLAIIEDAALSGALHQTANLLQKNNLPGDVRIIFRLRGSQNGSSTGMCVFTWRRVSWQICAVWRWSDVWVWEVMLTADYPDGVLTIGACDWKLPHSSKIYCFHASLMTWDPFECRYGLFYWVYWIVHLYKEDMKRLSICMQRWHIPVLPLSHLSAHVINGNLPSTITWS